MEKLTTKASEEQLLYAKLLSIGTWIGLAVLVITFFLYVSGVLEPVIPIDRLPSLWTMKATDYMHAENLPHGWGWVSLAGHGDFVNFIGVVMLSGLTVVCYLAILPIFIRKKDKAFIIMAVVEILILVLAASGILTAGGH
ncbi:MAG TPA: DUF1634 domain-containing protein [Nitrospirota bacterium]|nr:DUF1634 domain-containing protein [Nitrospirota bacterium]